MNKEIFHSPPFQDTNIRSLTKGISWRFFASVDTFFLSWLIFKNPVDAGSIATLEVATKIILYYFHERLWNLIPFGRLKNGAITHLRSIFKSVTWRLLGSLDTILLSYLLTGSFSGAVFLGASEVITKLFLFYVHERIWSGITWGRIYGENETALTYLAAGRAENEVLNPRP